jgi:hydroxyacylglutathione hydrolase
MADLQVAPTQNPEAGPAARADGRLQSDQVRSSIGPFGVKSLASKAVLSVRNPEPLPCLSPCPVNPTPTETHPVPGAHPLAAEPPHPRVQAIRAFKDNYIWVIVDPSGRKAALVDPGDGQKAALALKERALTLTDILITHHHADHVGGLDELKALWPEVCIHAPEHARIPQADRVLRGGETVRLEHIDLIVQVMAVPGHTLDHLAYFSPRLGIDPRPLLFCGDTLFAGGCGRLFEGTAEQMRASLKSLADCPPETLVYCAHEYTESNLKFALKVEPGNTALQGRAAQVGLARAADEATVPSCLKTEQHTNPFLRVTEASVLAAASAWRKMPINSPGDCLAAVRAWKDAG